MTKNKKRAWFPLLIGFVAGVGIAAAAGVAAYNVYLEAKRPKRYQVSLSEDMTIPLPGGGLVYAASSLDRIFKDGHTLVKPAIRKSVDVSAARHEYESFQVVVKAGEQPVRTVSLEISDLTEENGESKIEKANISWRVVGYVPTIKPYYPVKYVGLWPDPLMPAAATEVDPGSTQPFWVTIYVPPDAKAGNYSGLITVKAEGASSVEIPLKLRVYDFTLPVESRFKTAFDFYGHETFKRYPQGEKESAEAYDARLATINDKFIMAMLRYRINPILNIDPTKDSELALVDRYRVLGLNNFSIGKRGGTLGNNWPKDDGGIEGLLGLYRTYGEMLKLNKFLPYTYIYTWDEGKLGNPDVAKLCSMIHRAYPGLKNMVCYHGFWDPDKHPGWGKDIDIWTFQIDNFNLEKMRKLTDLGLEIWMYISGPGGYGTPNLAMDFDSMDYRIVPWLCWKYDIKGFLYWCVNWWPKVDPFKNAQNSKWEQNANGLLLYPGEDGPIASLRIEIFRDGMEDYEYIQALLDKMKIIKRQKLAGPFEKFYDQSKSLLTVDAKIAEAMDKFTRDGEVLKARRNAIAEKIEEFDRFYKAQTDPVPQP
ncbi:MAG: DUF6067 family protein [Candidatus Omnitrophota bacterium]|nr:DUF6067 family protein [Candidatus Omnitrophota bacterium]MDZ4241678.1 DUF6067 family protein [Candidatus Omnitrophota bacterium]